MNGDSGATATADEIYAELFAQLVTGHAQMAMMFLGRYPNPQTGATEEPQLEVAKIYLDQLEMLQAKTRGNLSVAESKLLGDMLMATSGAFAAVLDAQVGGNPAAEPTAGAW